MWIRSQDEEILLNLDCISALRYRVWYQDVNDCGPSHGIVAYMRNGGECYDFELGRYFSKKRVLDVFEEVEDDLADESCSVYYMPSE